MLTGRFHRHPARSDAAVALVQLCHMPVDGVANCGRGGQTLKLDFRLGLHDSLRFKIQESLSRPSADRLGCISMLTGISASFASIRQTRVAGPMISFRELCRSSSKVNLPPGFE